MKNFDRQWLGLGSLTLIVLLAFTTSPPEGLSLDAWRIIAVFLAVILSFVLRPLPMGAMVLAGLAILVISGTVDFKSSLHGFADSTVWLVVAAFIIAGAVIDTGFGKRVALLLILWIGKTITGIAYALCLSELILATVIPSNTARGGGILAPIVNALSKSMSPAKCDTSNMEGGFLSLVGAHANLIAASMFVTGMAANPLISKAAKDIFGISFEWSTWALGSIVPGIISLALLPPLLLRFQKADNKLVRSARNEAKQMMGQMGPVSKNEKSMMAVLLLMLILWTTKSLHGLDAGLVAWIGILILLISNSYSWDQIISNKYAWDALIWLGGLVTMAGLLMDYGFISWMTDHLSGFVEGMNWFWALLFLAVVYFYSMYGFSMLTGHIAAMAAPFLAVCFAMGAEPYLSVALFAYFSCLCGCTTYYSSGPVIIYFGLGFVSPVKWLQTGFFVSLFHLAIWIPVGLIWWKLIGWW